MQMIPVLYFDEDDIVAKELVQEVIKRREIVVYLFPVCGQVLELGVSRFDFIRTSREIRKFLNKRFDLKPPM